MKEKQMFIVTQAEPCDSTPSKIFIDPPVLCHSRREAANYITRDMKLHEYNHDAQKIMAKDIKNFATFYQRGFTWKVWIYTGDFHLA